MCSKNSVAPLVSVIVPAYNVEHHIETAIRSVDEQEFRDIELIVVDDCSTDATAETAAACLDGCRLEYRLIRYDKNRGVSAARNTGLDAARGVYVAFLDADDRYDSRFVQTLVDLSEQGKCDVSFSTGVDLDEETGRTTPWPDTPAAGLPPEELCRLRILSKIQPSVCSMLFRKDFLTENGLRFFEGCIAGEDAEFTIKAFCAAERISYTREPLYTYVHHSRMGSVADLADRDRHLQRYSSLIELNERVANFIEEHSSSARLHYLADHFLRPEIPVRRLTVAAKKHDRAEFDAIRKETGTSTALAKAITPLMLMLKPELVFKSLCALAMPGLFYISRSCK